MGSNRPIPPKQSRRQPAAPQRSIMQRTALTNTRDAIHLAPISSARQRPSPVDDRLPIPSECYLVKVTSKKVT